MNTFFVPKCVGFVSLMLAFVASVALALPNPSPLSSVLNGVGVLSAGLSVLAFAAIALAWAIARAEPDRPYRAGLSVCIGAAYLAFALIRPGPFDTPVGMLCLLAGSVAFALVMLALVSTRDIPVSANARFVSATVMTFGNSIVAWKILLGTFVAPDPVLSGVLALVSLGGWLGLLFWADRDPIYEREPEPVPDAAPIDTEGVLGDGSHMVDPLLLGKTLDIRV